MGDLHGSETARAELHSHTTYSDGMLSPAELVRAAQRLGLVALAVTDHDTVAGVAPARRAATRASLELIAGIEFSSNQEGKEVHVLGLFIDETETTLAEAVERSSAYRRQRGRHIVERLDDLGVQVDPGSVDRIAGDGSVGRPHIARALVEAGHTGSVEEAFRRYIGIGRPAYVPKPTLPASEVVDVIHTAGGVALLAHPGSSRVSDEMIVALVETGLDGFEIYHPKHGKDQQARLEALCRRLEVLPSGGSDFHGPGAGHTRLGEHAVPLAWVEGLRERAATYARERRR